MPNTQTENLITAKTETVTALNVCRGDVIRVGGTHTVVDLRNIGLGHKRLQFADGNAYILARSQTIQVTRLYLPPAARPPRPGQHPAAPCHQGTPA